jgi:hypothetical protein
LATNQTQPLLTEVLECAYGTSLPNAVIVTDRDQMAFHDVSESGKTLVTVNSQVLARQFLSDLLVIQGHQKADVTQAVVYPRRKMVLPQFSEVGLFLLVVLDAPASYCASRISRCYERTTCVPGSSSASIT